MICVILLGVVWCDSGGWAIIVWVTGFLGALGGGAGWSGCKAGNGGIALF